jgi:hypothetical protein
MRAHPAPIRESLGARALASHIPDSDTAESAFKLVSSGSPHLLPGPERSATTGQPAMTTRRPRPTRHPRLAATAAAVFALTLAACGGGNGEAPPVAGGSVVVPAAPVVTITNNITAETATGPITFTFSFNRDVGTSFTAEDIDVVGGSKGAFARLSGTRATLVVIPNPDSTGTVQVTVAAGSVTDATGQGNAATSASKAYDTMIPVVRTALVTFEESPAPELIGFGGAEDATVVTDPTNPANKVARIVKSATAELWAGTTVAVCPGQSIARVPFSSTMTRMSARVWSPVAGIPVRLKVENAADAAQSVETEATVTVASGWQTLIFDFAVPAAGTAALNPALTYDKASIFFNFGTAGAETGARTYYLDDLSFDGSSFTPSCAATGGGEGEGGGGGDGGDTFTITMDEVPPPTFAGFGGAEDATLVNDPAGGSNQVARIVKSAGAELWAGTTFSTLPGNQIPRIGFSASAKTVTVRVWSPVAGVPVRLKVEDADDPTKSVETEATVTAANTWQTLTFNFDDPATGTAALNLATTYNRASIFFNFGTPGAVTGERIYFFEDARFPAVSEGGVGGGGGGGGGTITTIGFSETTPPTFAGFGGAEDASIVADPTDASNSVARVLKAAGAQLWAGTTVVTGPDNTVPRLDFAASTTVTVRVRSPLANIPVRLKVENAADGGQSVETEAMVTAADTWQTLSFNFANPVAGTPAINPAGTYNRLSIFFNFGASGAEQGGDRVFYFDDVTYSSTSPTGGGGGGQAGVWASNYLGDLFVNSRSAEGGDVGFFFDDRLVATKAYDYAGLSGLAQNPGGVPNFYFGFGLNPPAITNAFFGAFIKAPGNAVADVSGFTQVKLNVWGPDQLFRAGNFPTLRVVLQGPARSGCNSPSGGSEVQTDFPTTRQGADSIYTLQLANFTIAHACNGETSVAQVLSAVTQFNVLLLNTNIQYVTRDPDGVAFTNGLNVGTLVFE